MLQPCVVSNGSMPCCQKNSYFIVVGKARRLSGKRSVTQPTESTPELSYCQDRKQQPEVDCLTEVSKEFVAVEDDNVCAALIYFMADKDILEFDKTSKSITDAAPFPRHPT
ncbi:hypothetical protein TNCV_223961 [Trichonephila clavipes]|nr:hypothetical protein TNCV_223961 [Trichonephila clavipes]